jgi:riboflavin transporter
VQALEEISRLDLFHLTDSQTTYFALQKEESPMNKQNNNTLNRQNNTIKLAKMGMLVAISVILVYFIHFPIFPAAPFLEYDPADIPIFIGTFAFGPLAGLTLTIVTSVIQGLTVSAAGGWFGILMHILATGSFVLVAGLIYRKSKTRKGAMIAMAAGTFTMTGMMAVANIILDPIFYGMPVEAVYALLPFIIGFNLIKAGANSIITFLLYKRISRFLHK